MVGEEMVGRDQCLVRDLEIGETGFGFRRSLRILRRVRLGVEVSGAAPKGQNKTQRDLILKTFKALKALLGQGVGTKV